MNILREQSDLGPFCLQYGLSKVYKEKSEQTTIVMNGGRRVTILKGTFLSWIL